MSLERGQSVIVDGDPSPSTATSSPWSTVLGNGNTSGGTDPVVSSGDSVRGEHAASGSGSGGGFLQLAGGDGDGAGNGGAAQCVGGTAGVTGFGGTAILSGGPGGATSGGGGQASVAGGNPTDGDGGDVRITATDAAGTNNNGGTVTIESGDETGSGSPGNVLLNPGNGQVFMQGPVSLQDTIELEQYTTAGLPAAGTAGRLAYDTTDNEPKYDDGSAWQAFGNGGAKLALTYANNGVQTAGSKNYLAAQQGSSNFTTNIADEENHHPCPVNGDVITASIRSKGNMGSTDVTIHKNGNTTPEDTQTVTIGAGSVGTVTFSGASFSVGDQIELAVNPTNNASGVVVANIVVQETA